MPLFGQKSDRPTLDGLTKDETRMRDALTPEVMRRAGETGVAGQAPAAAAILLEKIAAEQDAFLWPHLYGMQMMSARRFDQAVESFQTAIGRSPNEVRGYFGLANAYFEAAEDKRVQEGSAAFTGPMATMTIDNLYHEALRNFRRAYELTDDRGERAKLSSTISNVEKAIARKAGRI